MAIAFHDEVSTIYTLLSIVLNFLLLLIAIAVALTNAKKRLLSNAIVGIWISIPAISNGIFFLSSQQCAAFAVLILGPGSHSKYLQEEAVIANSLFLYRSLIWRDAKIEEQLVGLSSYYGRMEILENLIERGLPLNSQSSDKGYSPLHEAVRGHQYQSAEILIKNGAPTRLYDAEGNTPLLLAKKLRDERMIKILDSH